MKNNFTIPQTWQYELKKKKSFVLFLTRYSYIEAEMLQYQDKGIFKILTWQKEFNIKKMMEFKKTSHSSQSSFAPGAILAMKS